MGNETEEPWIVFSGCNSCINTVTCERVGSCVMLAVDKAIPEYNKRKRKLITRIRNGAPVDLKELLWVEGKEDPAPVINLTVFEKMAISSLNKKR